MRIYVDFDDCLCETGRALSKLALEMFHKHVPYDRMQYFELDRSFDLDAEQYERLMLRAHEPEMLLPVSGWMSMDFRTSDCTVSTNTEGIILSKTATAPLNWKTITG